jgi:ferric-dicitrate binding protein FerR (iron transport regulator)
MTSPQANTEERARRLMMGSLDDELSRQEQAELARVLDSDPALAAEWKQLQRVREVTRGMALQRPPNEVWDSYWTGVYRRLERGIGWILLSVGAIILISWGVWQGIQDLLDDATTPIVIKLGVLAVIVGLVVLFISVIREKLIVRQSDPYKDVER